MNECQVTNTRSLVQEQEERGEEGAEGSFLTTHESLIPVRLKDCGR